jgi:hypothetical protein
MIDTIEQAIDLSLTADKSKEYEAKFDLEINKNKWSCYAVSIANRDLLCFCDKGTATMLVDTYGDRTTCELYDWNEENQINNCQRRTESPHSVASIR